MQDNINNALKVAMKAHDEITVSTLRMLNSEVKNAEIDKHEKLTDDEVVKVIGKEAKKRRDAIEAFEKAGAKDMTERERQELAILEAYLPTQLSREEVEKLVDAAFAKTGASTMADMKVVMAEVMGQAPGQIDGGLVATLVKERLR